MIPRLVGTLCLPPLLIALSASVSAREDSQVGVVVEALTVNGAAERVGLREADIIQAWERAWAACLTPSVSVRRMGDTALAGNTRVPERLRAIE
jgi:hypothetical protein